jgi:hypothetical protein
LFSFLFTAETVVVASAFFCRSLPNVLADKVGQYPSASMKKAVADTEDDRVA